MNKRPNILLWVMDVQRARNLGCYGYARPTSPNIDRIAEDGVTFLNNISPAVWTLPSHASLFTGKYVSGHGVGQRYSYRPQEKFTLAQVLQSLGYLTLGFCRKGHRWARYGIDDSRGFTEFFPIDVPEEDEDNGSLETARELKERLEKYKGEKPFFIFINSTEPHLPYWPPQPFREKFLLKGVEEKKAKELAHLSTWEVRLKKRAVSPEDWEILKSLYDGETATLDNRIGVVFDYLKEKNLRDETLIIITSDHGDVQGEKGPYVLAHQLHIYDPALRVPLIVRYPEFFPSGLKIKFLTQTLDIFPTLMELLGVEDKEIWQQLQGFSLLSTIKGKPKRDFALAEYQSPLESLTRMMKIDSDWNFRILCKWLKAYYMQDYKYIWSSDGEDELYNIEEDPLESNNLLQQLPEKAREMRKKLEGFLSSFPHHDLGDKLSELERDKLEKESQVLKMWGFYRPDFFEKGGKRK